MSLFEKIEFQINRFLFWIIDFFWLVIGKIFPKKLIDTFLLKLKPLSNKYEVFKFKFDNYIKWLTLKIHKIKDIKSTLNLKNKKKWLKKFSTKITSTWYIDKLKRILVERFTRFKNAILQKMNKFNQYHLLFLTITLVISGFSFLGIYNSTTNIVMKEYTHQDRKIATIDFQQKSKFPDYFDHETKLSMISQLVMPAFIEDKGRYQNLKINFGIQFSNRTSKRFFDHYRYLFMDRLQVTLEPVLPSFPLTEEGKDIVRKKLFEELNDVLMSEKIDGRVKTITIIDIIAN